MQVKDKLYIYQKAIYFFNQQQSYPQVKRLLMKIADEETAEWITSKAEKEEWDRFFQKAKDLFSDGLIYDEVLTQLRKEGEDEDITKHAADTFYSLKLSEATNMIEGATNKSEAAIWLPISGIVFLLLLIFHDGLWYKILWGFMFLSALGLFFTSRYQDNVADNIRNYFAKKPKGNP
jgi:hypothetical protein